MLTTVSKGIHAIYEHVKGRCKSEAKGQEPWLFAKTEAALAADAYDLA